MNFFYACSARKSITGTFAIAAAALLNVSHADTGQTNSVATANVTFRTGALHTRKVIDSRGTAIAESDIIMGASEDFFKSDNQRMTRGLSNNAYGRIWPNGLVPYRISDQLSQETRRRVRDAVAHWNSFQAITLVERSSSNAGAYPDFVDFVKDDRCASWIGYQGNGAQSIYTGSNCSTGTIIHEIGHALGLLHEHTRSDRDQFVTIHWDRIDESMHINFEIMEGNIMLGSYDYASIMHYGEYFFSNNGRPTIVPLQQTSAPIGQRIETSPGDRAAITELYKTNNTLIANSSGTAAAGGATEVEFMISNNSDVGSNGLNLQIDVPADSKLLSYSSANWLCAQPSAGDEITCKTPVLPPNAQSKVSVNLQVTQTSQTMLLNAELTSRSTDTDLSDNQDSASITVVASSGVASSDISAPGVTTTSGTTSSQSLITANKQTDNNLQIASAMDGGGTTSPKELALAALVLYGIAWHRRRLTELKPTHANR